MNAVISGQAGVALLLDGKDISVLRAGRPGEVAHFHPSEIPFLLGEAKDLQFLESVDAAEARRQLESANDEMDALHLTLILLDSSLSDDTRATAAEELEELLRIERFQAFVEKVLFARPLPSEIDPSEAIASCIDYPLTRALLERLCYLQDVIREVYLAWEQVPESLFPGNGDREYAQTIAVREGFFRELSNLRAIEVSVDSFLLSALANSQFRAIRNHREILLTWTSPLRLNRRLASSYSDASLRDEYSETGLEDDQQARGGSYLLSKINRQKDAIVSAMIQHRSGKVAEYLEDLIDFQLKRGGAIYACKSLCDLAIKAKGIGLYKLQLDLTARAVELKSDDGWSWAQHADALRQNGKLRESLSAYDRALVYSNDVEVLNGRADVLKAQSRLEEALSEYESVITEFPGNVVARNGRADVLKTQNRLDEALSAYESVIAEFPGDVVARNGRAEVLKAQNRLDEALSAYDSVIAEFPGNVVARAGRADVLKAQNRLDEALLAYDSVIAEFPGNVVARAGRAEVLKAQNRLDEALSEYDSVIAEFPGDVVARAGRAEVLKAQNRSDEALSAYDSVIAEFPGNVVARNGRAEMLKAQNRLDEALSAYESVIAEFPGNRVAKNGCASLLALMQRWEEALAMLPEQSPITKDDWTGYHIRGMVLLRMGSFDEARAIFESGVAQCPRPAQRPSFVTALAIALLKRKSYLEAQETLEKVRSAQLESQLNVLRFHTYGALGNTVRAVEISESLRPSESSSPRVREIGAELRRRYLEKRSPLHSDDWLVEREIDLLLAA